MRLPQDQNHSVRTGTTFTFLQQRSIPLRPGSSCVDIAIYRTASQQLDLARLSVSTTELESGRGGRKGSGLTEMMKMKTRAGSGGLDVESRVKVTWALPSGQDLVLPAISLKNQKDHVTR
jgi:hypothetical protein